MTSNIEDLFKAADSIKEDDMINIFENYIQVPNPRAEYQMMSGRFSVRTLQRSSGGSESEQERKLLDFFF